MNCVIKTDGFRNPILARKKDYRNLPMNRLLPLGYAYHYPSCNILRKFQSFNFNPSIPPLNP